MDRWDSEREGKGHLDKWLKYEQGVFVRQQGHRMFNHLSLALFSEH